MAKLRKWIQHQSEAPVSEVVCKILTRRLRSVRRSLRSAALHPEETDEHTHQVRVSTRKATAALELFADLLPTKRSAWMKKRLGRIRRAAGEARDLDVFRKRLTESKDLAVSPEAEHALLRLLDKRRQRSQRDVVKAYEKALRQELKRRIRALVRRVRWRVDGSEPSYLDAARAALPSLPQEFFSAASGDLADPAALHEMRIRAKHLRYALQLLTAAFDRSFRESVTPVFSEVQRKLGAINDHVTAQRLLHELAEHARRKSNPPLAAELDRLAQEEATFIRARSNEFLAWWTPERCAQLRAKFDEVLATSSAK